MRKISLALITGNMNKRREFMQILGPSFQLTSYSTQLYEIQGSVSQIVKFKTHQAYKLFGENVIVEDTSLAFNAYNGMPGPYIKWFHRALGSEGMFKMVQRLDDQTAFAQCVIGYMNKDLAQPKVFTAKVNGTIVSPRGSNGFGWDSIFKPDGHNKTYAQMSHEQKNQISHRYKAIMKLKKCLLEAQLNKEVK